MRSAHTQLLTVGGVEWSKTRGKKDGENTAFQVTWDFWPPTLLIQILSFFFSQTIHSLFLSGKWNEKNSRTYLKSPIYVYDVRKRVSTHLKQEIREQEICNVWQSITDKKSSPIFSFRFRRRWQLLFPTPFLVSLFFICISERSIINYLRGHHEWKVGIRDTLFTMHCNATELSNIVEAVFTKPADVWRSVKARDEEKVNKHFCTVGFSSGSVNISAIHKIRQYSVNKGAPSNMNFTFAFDRKFFFALKTWRAGQIFADRHKGRLC